MRYIYNGQIYIQGWNVCTGEKAEVPKGAIPIFGRLHLEVCGGCVSTEIKIGDRYRLDDAVCIRTEGGIYENVSRGTRHEQPNWWHFQWKIHGLVRIKSDLYTSWVERGLAYWVKGDITRWFDEGEYIEVHTYQPEGAECMVELMKEKYNAL